MRQLVWFIVILCSMPCLPLAGSSLPGWIEKAMVEASTAKTPTDADVWVLLDRTEFKYTGNGEIRKRRYRVVRVLTAAGNSERIYALQGLGGKASRVKKLKGWLLDPEGEVHTLDKSDVVTLDSDGSDELSSAFQTGAGFPEARPGSLVGFESQEVIRHPLGPMSLSAILQRYPVLRWEVGVERGWFTPSNLTLRLEPRGLEAFHLTNLGGANQLVFQGLPPAPVGESWAPPRILHEPRMYLRILDPEVDLPPTWDWAKLGAWVAGRYKDCIDALDLPIPDSGDAMERLRNTLAWMDHNLHYQEVHLSPDGGWIPVRSALVKQRGYGDCKEMMGFLAGALKGHGIKVFPVLVRSGLDDIPEDEPPGPFLFNHAIAAIQVEQPTGLPSEVVTSSGRFLLVDPTIPWVPLGRLPGSDVARRVMICTPQGGTWVTVPGTAGLDSGWSIRLQGQVGGEGGFKGGLTVQESWGAMGLFQAQRESGEQGLKRRLGEILGLGASASWHLTRWTPLQAEAGVYSAELEGEIPGLFSQRGTRWQLGQIGPVICPGPLAPVGRTRAMEVLWQPRGKFSLEGDLTFSGDPVALAEARKAALPWGDLTWESTLEANRLRFKFEYRHAGLVAHAADLPRTEQAWKDGRNVCSDFLEEVTLQRILPKPTVASVSSPVPSPAVGTVAPRKKRRAKP